MAGRETGLVVSIVSSRDAAMIKTSGGRGWGRDQGDGRGEERWGQTEGDGRREERQTRRHPLAAFAARAQEQRGGEGG